MLHASRFLTIAVVGLVAAGNAFAQSENTAVRSPFPPRVERRGDLEIRIGEIRVVMRGPMFPSLADMGDGILMITAHRDEEGGEVLSIRSEDGGNTWRPYEPGIPRGAGMNTLRLQEGRILSLMYDTRPLPDKPGYYSTTRWESDDQWKTVRGPLTDGTLFLPPEDFDPAKVQWFHGNTIQLPGGELLSAMQGLEKGSQGFYPFHTFVSRSADGGKTWEFLSRVASISNLDDPDGATRRGWKLHGPCEHNLLHLGDGRLICAARLVNDDHAPLVAAPSDTYRDLSYTISGAGIHPGTLPADRFYVPGPRSAPLVLSFSDDSGRTWTPPRPMREACGCFPRMAASEGIAALSYGGVAYPRWGNCLVLSTDGGKTWTDEINYAPFLTTGYTDIITLGPKRFLCVFDCTPPQPWKAHATHWVGIVEIEVAKSK